MNDKNNLVNYELTSSNSINYSTYLRSSSPQSFPEVMENGLIIKYEQVNFTSNFVQDKNSVYNQEKQYDIKM